jgi:hypothetical protein
MVCLLMAISSNFLLISKSLEQTDSLCEVLRGCRCDLIYFLWWRELRIFAGKGLYFFLRTLLGKWVELVMKAYWKLMVFRCIYFLLVIDYL